MTAEEYVRHYASGQGGFVSVSVDVALRAIEYAKREAKQQLMKDAVDGWIEEPECLAWRVISDNLEGDFVVKNKLQDGESVKVIIIKED